MKILIPDTIELGTPPSGFEVVRYPVSQPLAAENDDADVLVVWQNPASWLADAASRLRQLRLVQTLAAGPDAVLAAGFRAEAQISSGRSLHDATVAEHALALTLACTRRLDRLRDAQREHRWDTAYIAAQESVSEGHRFTLHGAAVTIWGFGSIAATLAPMLSLLGADVVGVAGSPGERSGFRVIAAGGDRCPDLRASGHTANQRCVQRREDVSTQVRSPVREHRSRVHCRRDSPSRRARVRSDQLRRTRCVCDRTPAARLAPVGCAEPVADAACRRQSSARGG
jgi:hypothetical protein